MGAFERISFDVDGTDLHIDFCWDEAGEITGLLAAPWVRDSPVRFDVRESEHPGFTYAATVDLRRVAANREPGDGRVALFVEMAGDDGEVILEQLGRARLTDRALRTLQASIGDVDARVEIGPGGNIVLAVTDELPRAALKLVPTELGQRGPHLEITAKTEGDVPIVAADVVFTERSTGAAFHVPMQVTPDEAAIRNRRGRLIYDLATTVDMAAVTEKLPCRNTYIPVSVVLTDDRGEEYMRRIGLPERGGQKMLRPMTTTTTPTTTAPGRTTHFVPYLTFKQANISLKVDQFDPEAFESMQRWMRWSWLSPLARMFAGVWLVGELSDRAQDNGYHLFRWIRENRPSKRVHYVIAGDSPDRERLERLGNVVVRGSREHVRYSFLATRLVSTHLPQYLLPTPDPRMVRRAHGTRVFLQHGIMGMKNMVANYGRRSFDFRCDVFHVSSAREREMIINDFGYLPEQVRITGLPRFDALLAPGDEPHGILVLPTWREWLLRPETFVDSEFIERWRSLLSDERLGRLIAAGERVTFVLHPNMVHHSDLFAAPAGVTVIRPGERDVQQLLREHRALITDYSSVGFDFALQYRPVYYFQFDRDRFLGKHPSHLDPVLDLPGYVTPFEDDLLAQLEKDWQAGFRMPEENARRIGKWVDHEDRNNSERAYRSVKDSGGLRTLARRIRTSAAAGRLYERFRKSPRYASAMRGLMAVARTMPRADTVVFESGNGRHYAGNPRAVYEELVRRETGLRTVWSSTSTFRPADPGTRKVEPRSPRYYWELGRARFWVTDQNLGLDVRPSRRTYYLQTWHGTPLKRMQHDALSHEGRKPGYLERVTQQTGYWSCLLSPSRYATERFRSAFRYTGEVLEAGYPRNDALAGAGLAERRDATRARLGVASDKRLVLFAPTFRDNVRQGNRFAFKSGLNLTELAEQLPDDVLFLIRAHHVAGRSVHIPHQVRDRIIDVTSYDDAQDLMAAADALITDYSSTMFDYALTRRPMLFFCPDLEEYGGELRGFYFDFEAEAPGPILRSQDELVAALHDLDGIWEAYGAELESFIERYGPLDDGGAAARVVDHLLAR